VPILFTDTLDAGQYKEWQSILWSPDDVVEFSVRPAAGSVGPVSLRALAVERADDESLTYIFTVWNVSTERCNFEVWYSAIRVVANPEMKYSIKAGQALEITWGMETGVGFAGFPPMPCSIIARPSASSPDNPILECSLASIQWQLPNFTIYTFTVTDQTPVGKIPIGSGKQAQAYEFYLVAVFFMV